MNSWLLFILIILLGGFLLEQTITYLNLKALDPQVPKEFSDIVDAKKYRNSQDYTRSNSTLELIESSTYTLFLLFFLLAGGFNAVDILVRSLHFGSIITGLFYIGSLFLISFLIALPFRYYSTFFIEERFGFNKTTLMTFWTDILKGILLSIVLGAPILGLILWFFETAGAMAWLYCWLGVVVFTFILQFLAPVLIMPLFNKFTPLDDSILKEKVLVFAKKESFNIQGIYTMDGSKRSSKLNAFFTGFGRFRKIVFYDTLLEKLDDNEIIAVLAHEMGHYKRHHLFKMMAISTLHTGLLFFLLSCFLGNQALFSAFKMEHLSVYAGLIFFSFIFSPVNLLLGIGANYLSRRHEYEADSYASTASTQGIALVNGLKKLSIANLANLTPHPAMVFFHYSHPPVLDRIKTMKNMRGITQ